VKRVPTTLQARGMAQGSTGWYRYQRDHPERAAFYASGAWRGARARHLRANPNCAVCGEPAKIVDHIVPRAEYGADIDPANLQSLCKKHHAQKTQAESHRGRKRAAERRKR
jgi:5-methylcytosine-specific restriction endonuclease McrA